MDVILFCGGVEYDHRNDLIIFGVDLVAPLVILYGNKETFALSFEPTCSETHANVLK